MKKFSYISVMLTLTMLILLTFSSAKAEKEESGALKVIETQGSAQTQVPLTKAVEENTELPAKTSNFDPLTYKLGPDDVVEIIVMRHPEFSGTYPINLEGKIQYKFVGDIDVTDLTKQELEQKIKDVVSSYLISPEVNITVTEYKSKVIYVLGEVGQPGKYYMRSESIPVREAVVQAGLPTLSAAMRKCRIVTPDKNGRVKTRAVDLYSVLYGGKLQYNLDMHPGDVLYVPATIMAKIIRMVNPVTSAVGVTASAPSDVGSARAAATALAK